MEAKKKENLLEVNDLKMYFPVRQGFFSKKVADVKAVDGVSFAIPRGRTFGLVGESGCGKTTTGKCILRIYNPTSGEIWYNGRNIAHASRSQITPFRREIQLIFQDPYSSLDPRQSVGAILREAITEDHARHSASEVKAKIDELLCTVELDPSMKDRYPHEMSGGQRQRLGIARALACDPELIVCDEPVSALDVSIQAQIINLLKKLQKEYGLTYLFVAHDLAVVRHIADEVGVMYLGRIVEKMNADELYSNPLHPYTKALMSAIPITDYYEERRRNRILLEGEVPSPIHAPAGCPFHPRCRHATEECKCAMPQMQQVGDNHTVACYNWRAVQTKD